MAELASYAVKDETSAGRAHPERTARHRGEFQRDRDRVIHSAAFRRLEYKTQVFLNHEGDMFRTRLTHSIEVAQIGRTIARALRLNEDLVEAIALAHDLGHTPFGHAGQEALNACMREFGGFEHNLQSLRVVDSLEQRYPDFDGLNLMFETREGVLKHCSRANAVRIGAVGARFLDGTQPSLEAQVANLADEIAYNGHDIDDGLRSGLLGLTQLESVDRCRALLAELRAAHPHADDKRLGAALVRRWIDAQVTDLIEASARRLDESGLRGIADVRRAGRPLIGFGEEMQARHVELKRFLRVNLYEHERVTRMTGHAAAIVRALFEVYLHRPNPTPAFTHGDDGEPRVRARRVADYIAGMTDRYAIAEHERRIGPVRFE